jgi:hypothetical protein
MVPDGTIWPAQTPSGGLNQERLQALLKPVSHVRIMPGARCDLRGAREHAAQPSEVAAPYPARPPAAILMSIYGHDNKQSELCFRLMHRDTGHMEMR